MTDIEPAFDELQPPLDWALVDRYFAGECTPAEASVIREWVDGDPVRAARLEEVHRIWRAAAALPPVRFDVDAGWKSLQERMTSLTLVDADGEMPARESSSAHRLGVMYRGQRTRWRLVGIAAAVLVVVGGAAIARQVTAVSAGGEQITREYATGIGQRADVMLPDGTRVWLGVGSRLRVPAAYDERERELHLEGEGYFDVASDPRRPFIVHANGVVAEALGTEFVVRRFADDDVSVVAVLTGDVAVRTDSGGAPRRGVALAAGQLATVSDAGLITVTPDADVGRYAGFREGRLEFQGEPLRQVARELARWYDLELVVEDSALAAVPITGTFTNLPASAVVSIVCTTLSARCERDGNVVRVNE